MFMKKTCITLFFKPCKIKIKSYRLIADEIVGKFLQYIIVRNGVVLKAIVVIYYKDQSVVAKILSLKQVAKIST